DPHAAMLFGPAVVSRTAGDGVIQIMLTFQHLRRCGTAGPLTKHVEQPASKGFGFKDATVKQQVRWPHRLAALPLRAQKRGQMPSHAGVGLKRQAKLLKSRLPPPRRPAADGEKREKVLQQ